MAVFFFSMYSLGLVVALTAIVFILIKPNVPIKATLPMLLGGIAFSAITWVIAFFIRRSVHCPLCLGTPLINSGARAHAEAKRILYLNHGSSAMLSILATQRFRCMYCGSNFDLLKPHVSRIRVEHRTAENPTTHDSMS